MYAVQETRIENMDTILENEKQTNKAESWNKLDKTVKTQVLHAYAELYGQENKLTLPEIKTLKQFFSECLKTNKLTKAKEVKYDKESRTITGVPALTNTNNRYTLRNLDAKRVNTLKSLTPIRTTIKSKIETETELEG
jgi:hypothetical protein